MARQIGRIIGLGMIGAGLLVWPHHAEASGEWSRLGVGLNGQMVSAIAADPNNSNQLAVISNGRLYTSSTSGLIWQLEPTPGLVTAVAYDPAQHGRLWIGAVGSCLASRTSGSVLWHTYDDGTGCDPVRIVPTTRGIYYLDYRETTITPKRLTPSGTVNALHYSGSRPFYLAAASSGRHLYIAGQAELQRSDDDGASWVATTKPVSANCCVNDLWADDETVWQLAYGRPYRSRDEGATWTAVGPVAPSSAGIGRLAIHGDTPFFSMAFDGGSPADVVTQATDPISGLGLGQFATALVVNGNHLTAATQDGVWRYQTALPSVAKRLRPVIVIPGLLGSWPADHGVRGALVIDPILHTYDGLLARLRAVGYNEADGTLVPFPYQWRQDNTTSAQELAALIARTTAACGCKSVDIVSHSMGGLVAREYIESSGYRGDVARLVEIATPNEGSPDAYPVWENAALADDSFGIGEAAMAHLFVEVIRVEGLLKRYVSVVDYIRDGIPSVGQLLPDADYLAGRSYPLSYPANHFLDQLNAASGIDRLQSRVGLFVVGGQSQPTINQFTVAAPTGNHGWPDGMVTGRTLGEGDGAVPQSSLAGIGQINALFSTDHASVVTAAADRIIAYLLGDTPDDDYRAAVPKAHELATAVAKAPTVSRPKQAALIYAKAPATVKVSTRSTRLPTSKTTHTTVTPITQTYGYGDDQGSYVIVTPPEDTPESGVVVTVDPESPSTPTPVTVIETDDMGVVTTTTTTLPASSGETEVGVILSSNGPVLALADGSAPLSASVSHRTSIIAPSPSSLIATQTTSKTTSKLFVAAVSQFQPTRSKGAPGQAPHIVTTTLLKPKLWPIWIIGFGFGIVIWWLLLLFWRRRARRLADKTSDQA